MAGIEKICEFSGEYPECGWDMYSWKKDHIQVMPKYRKEFKKHDGFLLFLMVPRLVTYSDDGPFYFINVGGVRIPRVWSRYYWLWRRIGHFYDNASLVWDYCLYVPRLPGRVQGKYWNFTTNPQKVVRNLNKLVKYLYVESIPFNEENRRAYGPSVERVFDIEENE